MSLWEITLKYPQKLEVLYFLNKIVKIKILKFDVNFKKIPFFLKLYIYIFLLYNIRLKINFYKLAYKIIIHLLILANLNKLLIIKIK